MNVTKWAGARSSPGVPRALPLPGVELPLEEKPPLDGRDQLLGRPPVIVVVRLAPPRQGDHGRVMKVVVPHRVEAVAAGRGRPHQPDVLGLVLGDDDGRGGRAPPGGRPPATAARMCSGDRSKIACVASRRRPSRWNSSIQYPALASTNSRTGPASGPVEVEGRAPFGLIAIGEVVRRRIAPGNCRPGRGGCRRRPGSRRARSAWARSTKRRKSSGVP